jgi:hypothetical protein
MQCRLQAYMPWIALALLSACAESAPANSSADADDTGDVAAAGDADGAGDADDAGDAADAGTPSDSELRAAACERSSFAWCARLAACSPVDLWQYFGTLESCRAADAIRCEHELTLDGVNADPAGVDAATERLEHVSCREVVIGSYRAHGTLHGTRSEGETCEAALGFQCVTGYCQVPETGFCGTCLSRPDPIEMAGEPCSISESQFGNSYDCRAPGLICDIPSETCVLVTAAGDPCRTSERDPAGTCDSGLVCRAGICEEPLYLGESCTPEADSCSRDAHLVCGSGSTCELPPEHVDGECGGYPPSKVCRGWADECKPNSMAEDLPGSCTLRVAPGLGGACTSEHPLDLERCPRAFQCINGSCQVVGRTLRCD